MNANIPSLWDAIRTGNVREIAAQIKPSPAVADCDVCRERPGVNKLVAGGTDTCACDECIDDDYRQMRRLPRFRTDDDAAAYEAGVRSRGEI